MTDAAKAAILDRCKNNPPDSVNSVKIREVRTADGFKFVLENGSWFLIRPSGTEALIRVYFEADSAPKLQSLIAPVKDLIDQWGKTIAG